MFILAFVLLEMLGHVVNGKIFVEICKGGGTSCSILRFVMIKKLFVKRFALLPVGMPKNDPVPWIAISF